MSTRLSKKVRPYVEAGLLVALALVLSAMVVFRAPLGGSVTLGATIPVCLVGLRHGVGLGLLAGLNYGVINFMLGGTVVGAGPFVLDYILAGMSLGLAGIWRNHPFLGLALAQMVRTTCHVLSGVLFFSQGDYSIASLNLSLKYNLWFLLPDILIGVILFYRLIKNSPTLIHKDGAVSN